MDYKYSIKIKIDNATCYLTPTQYTNSIPVLSWNGYFLNNLCVPKEYRRKGYAKKLLEKVIEKTKNESKDHIILVVYRENIGAVDLYQKLGFRDYQSDTKHIIMVKNIV